MTRIIPNRTYKYGTIDTIEPQSIPRGAVASSLNWLTMGDHMELRRGHDYIGTANDGNGKVSGVKRTVRNDGVEQLFATYGKKLKYLDRDTADWLENGSDLLGAAVVDDNGVATEPVSISEYVSPAGNQAWVNSPNIANILKVLVANPGSSVGQYDSSKNFKGQIKIDTNRMLLWARTSDKTGLYGSYVDIQSYTTITNEAVGTGDGATKHFTATAAGRTGKRTLFGFILYVGGVSFATDDYSGNLRDSSGVIQGTVNYATGAIVMDFTSAPGNGQALTVDYQWEDSTSNGIADFTKSSPRTAGQGFIFRQDEGGGALKSVGQYDQIYYCFHIKKTWVLDIGADDTTATNLPFRENVGVAALRGQVESGNGIYYADETSSNNKRIRLLAYDVRGSAKVIPVSLSNNINLDDYDFSEAASFEFGDFVLISCATEDSVAEIDGESVPANNRTLLYNKIWKSWDVLDFAISCFDTYDGALVGGSSISNNIFELFSGLVDPDDTLIPNFCVFDLDDLDQEGLKKVKYIHAQGTIGPDQKIKVSLSVDNGAFVEIGGEDTTDPDTNITTHTYAIEGGGSYVDRTTRVLIGPNVIGKRELGGGGTGVEAYNFDRLIPVRLDKGEHFQLKIEAVDVGWAGWSKADWYDVRDKGRKIPRKYRTVA